MNALRAFPENPDNFIMLEDRSTVNACSGGVGDDQRWTELWWVEYTLMHLNPKLLA